MASEISFSPPWYARNPHFQTLISPITRKVNYTSVEETWDIESEGGVRLIGKLWRGESKRIVFIYHGLGGNEDAPYVMGLAKALHQRWFSVVRMRLRGAEEDEPVTPYLYHAGLTEDFGPAVQHAQNLGFEDIYMVGFSLSGNALLKWLGEGFKPVKSAFVVSPPVRLSECAQLIDHHWGNKIYQKYFLRKLRSALNLKSKWYPEQFKPVSRFSIRSMREFDDQITAPFNGFRNASDYYERASSYQTLSNIENRCLILHSLDDPFVDSSDLVEWKGRKDSPVLVKLLPRGGHVGFYGGPRQGYQVDLWATEYFNAGR